jgi:hypothetical protein
MAKKKKPAASRNGKAAPRKPGRILVSASAIKRSDFWDERATYANHVVVRSDPSIFQFFFYDAEPTLSTDDPPMEASEIEVNAKCVARIVLPSHVLPGLLNALQVNYERQHQIAEEHQALMEEAMKGLG